MTQKSYTIYNLETGEGIQTGNAPESQMDALRGVLEEGQGFIEKAVDFATQRVSKDKRVISRKASDVTKDQNDEALRMLKNKRDFLLKESDWTQMPDAPVDQEAWRVYRQKLRDLPSMVENLLEPVFPAPPTA